MLKTEHLFIDVAGRYSDLAYVSVRNRQLDSDDVSHSLFNAYDQGKVLYVGKTLWDTQSMIVIQKPVEMMLAVSSDGFAYTYVAGIENVERVPGVIGELRNLAAIEGFCYACGTRRQVFKRVAESQWIAMHGPVPTKRDDGKVIGFEAISGFSASEIYAVGWGGEIWVAKNEVWSQVDSPTTAILTAIECAEGHVYAAGRNGTLLRGRDSAWEVIDTDGIVDDFWDLCWFNNRLYVSSLARLYELHDDSFMPVSIQGDRPSTCLKLSSADGILWSVGTDDFFSFDGTTWRRIE